MTDPNGSYVTQREFGRLERKVDEVGADVKLLLAAYNREEGAEEVQRDQASTHRDGMARRVAWGSLITAAVGVLANLGGHHHIP